ncbi:Uncharacterised protein [Vibrio cholerae]|uniref:Uncharacterized protein n=1 Tax=Vibrio cholerae TaxID=666 RepID=A0A655QEC3_VIBCL|nr:Uncharacterised protein [Vibrio cholerae]CSA54754.1 Uncharacterised protein [Vibrio cholerae]CSA60583.1 Uncharacterised protein [Vibrio cholerae]CSC35538.1 Uncharacterised protein [Vibrio cholerae]
MLMQLFSMSRLRMARQVLRAGNQNVFYFTDFTSYQAGITLWANSENHIPFSGVEIVGLVTHHQLNMNIGVFFHKGIEHRHHHSFCQIGWCRNTNASRRTTTFIGDLFCH